MGRPARKYFLNQAFDSMDALEDKSEVALSIMKTRPLGCTPSPLGTGS
jgi:hypothetical protein